MSRSLFISGALACLVIAAGFFILENDSKPAKNAVPSGAPPSGAKPAATPSGVRVVWPTPYPFFANKAAPDTAFLQPTVSGNPTSATYGMTRSGGAQFHEGVDIRPVSRDRRGEPTDAVYAAMDGRVAYANGSANGAYGRYVVIEHAVGGLALYTLYAHLASVAPGLRAGERVEAGAPLGVLGRSDASGGFAKDRAHLHFEVGLRLSDAFHLWYAPRHPKDPNLHGNFNGYNLAGLDPLEFLKLARERSGELTPERVEDWVRNTPVAVTVETPAVGVPGLLRRCPALIVGGKPAVSPRGWRIGFSAAGVPIRWEPLQTSPATTRIVAVADGDAGRDARRRGLFVTRSAKRALYAPGKTLEIALALIRAD